MLCTKSFYYINTREILSFSSETGISYSEIKNVYFTARCHSTNVTTEHTVENDGFLNVLLSKQKGKIYVIKIVTNLAFQLSKKKQENTATIDNSPMRKRPRRNYRAVVLLMIYCGIRNEIVTFAYYN